MKFICNYCNKIADDNEKELKIHNKKRKIGI